MQLIFQYIYRYLKDERMIDETEVFLDDSFLLLLRVKCM